MYALQPEALDIGTLRETFVLNQVSVNHNVTYPNKGDFLFDGKYLIEVGGSSKDARQIKGVPNSFLILDGIEYPDRKKIPLWLFSFLY